MRGSSAFQPNGAILLRLQPRGFVGIAAELDGLPPLAANRPKSTDTPQETGAKEFV
jgi:hypothetical protein